jgi:hypothetical protein
MSQKDSELDISGFESRFYGQVKFFQDSAASSIK